MTTADRASPPPGLVVPIEEAARRAALAVDRAGSRLGPDIRAMIAEADATFAESDPAGVDRRRIHCGPEQARALLEYFHHVAAALQQRGDYEGSTACAQAAESLRRTLEGPAAT